MSEQPPKPATKASLQGELTSFVATTHGEIREAAESIAKALDQLIEAENVENKEKFQAIVTRAMTVPNSSHFQNADPQVKAAIKEILTHAQEVINAGLSDLITANEEIKKKKREIKERIQKIEADSQTRPGPGRR